MEAAAESEAALGMKGWSGGRRSGLWRGSQPAEPLPPVPVPVPVRGTGQRSFVLLNFALRCRWKCRVPAASHPKEREGGSEGMDSAGNFPWVGRTAEERGGEEKAAHSERSLRGRGCFGEGGREQGLCAVRGHCQQQSVAPFAICRFPWGGSCLGALDHKGLKELG